MLFVYVLMFLSSLSPSPYTCICTYIHIHIHMYGNNLLILPFKIQSNIYYVKKLNNVAMNLDYCAFSALHPYRWGN